MAGTSEEKGYDAGKKIKGRKRHIATDTQGNVIAVGITAASVHDKLGVLKLKEEVEDHTKVVKIVADGAYRGVPPFTAQGRIEWEIMKKKLQGHIQSAAETLDRRAHISLTLQLQKVKQRL